MKRLLGVVALVGDTGAPFQVYANRDLSVGQAESLLNDDSDDTSLFVLLRIVCTGRLIYVLCNDTDLILRLVGP